MAGPNEGLSSYTFLTGEEAPERVAVPAGAPYGADPAYAPANDRQSGYSVVLDPVTGDFTQVAGMGRHNHENEMVLPGDWDQIAIFSGDDTFTPPAPASQLYLYLADDLDALWADHGSLWAFQATGRNGLKVDAMNPLNNANDYSDIVPGDHFQGRFIRVPAKIAKGLTSAEPQTALENWSNANNVFQFIRIEDSAYDPRVGPGENPVMYFADTGNGNVIEGPNGQLIAGAGPFNRGRVFRMEFAPDNPRKVVDLSILIDGNAATNPIPGGALRNPDNLAMGTESLMLQEDISSASASRLLRYDLDGGTWSVVGAVNTVGWESSGVVDASDFYGPGNWLLDVQAHSIFVGPTDTTTTPGVTYKTEGGQLLLLTLPGS
jgi:secreted PhoX family phosphatase